MSKGVKLIIVVLFLLLAGSVFFALSTLSQMEALQKTKMALEGELTQSKEKEQRLNQDNKKLGDQIKEAQGLQTKLQKQVIELNDQLTALTVERDDWKNKIEELRKERDDLVKKIQEKPAVTSSFSAQETGMTAAASSATAPAQEQYWADVLKEKASLEVKLAELQTDLSSGSVEFGDLKKKNSDFELELSQLKNEKEDIERKVKYSEDLANTLSIQLVQEKNDKRYVADKVGKLTEENLALRAQVKELASARVALEKSIAKLVSDKDAVEKKLFMTESLIQNRIDEVLDIKRSLDKRLQTAGQSGSKEIELPPIIVSAPATGGGNKPSSSKPNLNGRVISINPDNNFVVVDLGENAGIRMGDTLSVYRGSKLVATLDVIQVRKDISAADIRQKGAKIEVGDSVR